MENTLYIDIEKIKYGDTIVINNNSISINNNGIYGFFGKNGEGKTTFLKSIAGIKKFKGNITFNYDHSEKIKIAWVPAEPDMYEYLKVSEFYSFFKSLNKNRISKSFLFDIDETKIIKECSTGTKKKIYLNTIFQFNDYDLIILDEPFNGLDLESTYIFYNFIKKLSETKIILISSHIIEIIEDIITNCFYIEKGYIRDISIKDLKKWIS